MKIWLSYYFKDQEIAQKIFNGLKKFNYDIENYESVIKPGDSIIDKLYSSISSSDVFLFIISKKSSQDNNYPQELSLALSEYKKNQSKKIIPIIIDDDVVFPPFLSQFQGIRLNRYSQFDDFITSLSNSIQSKKELQDFTIVAEKGARYVFDDIKMEKLLYQRELKEIQISKEKETKQIIIFLISFFLTLLGVVLAIISLSIISATNSPFILGLFSGAIIGIAFSIMIHFFKIRSEKMKTDGDGHGK
jgi:hypothetical protein